MCRQCFLDDELMDDAVAEMAELDEIFGLNEDEDAVADSTGDPTEPTPPLYNEGVSFVMQQGNDLETLRRLQQLQDDLEEHVRELRRAAYVIVNLKDSLNLSATPLRRGAMPEWYEVTTHATGNLLQNVVANLEYVADRLEKDYAG